jgi:uncharacterized damage-inducible protein DinB
VAGSSQPETGSLFSSWWARRLFMNISVTDLIDYTKWEREKFHELFRTCGRAGAEDQSWPSRRWPLSANGDWVRHIFSAEKRYVDRLSNRPLTDTASVPTDNIEALFEFARQSRKELERLLETLSETAWNAPLQFKLMNSVVTASPKKIVTHILVHEIRHWAQIATLLRLQGVRDDFHDLLMSPVMGGGFQRGS